MSVLRKKRVYLKMKDDITIDSLIEIRKQLIKDYGQPAKRIEFNPRDFIKIRKIFKELIPNEIIQQYKLDDRKFRNKLEPKVLFCGIKLIENKKVKRNYLNIIY